MWNELIDEVRGQQSCLDMLSAAWCAEYGTAGGRIFCGKGCHGCCTLAVNTTCAEAVIIAARLTDQQSEAVRLHVDCMRNHVYPGMELKEYLRMHRREIGSCPFLNKDGTCSIYAIRPLSCRSLLSTMDSHWCSEDFTSLSASVKQEFVESLDRQVVAFPTHYAASPQEMAQEMEARANRLMMEKFGFSLYGSLPVLVHLAREHGLAEACRKGKDDVVALITKTKLDNPLLLPLTP